MKNIMKIAAVIAMAICACVCEAKTIKQHGLKVSSTSHVARRAAAKKAAIEAKVDLEWAAIPDCMKNDLDEAAWKAQRKQYIENGWKKTYSDEAAERHAQKAVLLKTTTTCWYYVPASTPQASAPKPAAKPKAKKRAKDIDVMAELPPEVRELFAGSDVIVK